MSRMLRLSERIYERLLSLYPVSFRVRFAPEMALVFRDCCRDALDQHRLFVILRFWLHTIGDVTFSVMRERHRELMGPVDSAHPVMAIIDLVLIPGIIAMNLLALGPIVTLLIARGAQIPPDTFTMASGFFSFAIGSLTLLASIIVSKVRPTVRLCIKLSS